MLISNNEIISIDGDDYIKICPSQDVFEGKGIQVQFEDDDDFQVAILRVKNVLYALDNICPHRHADRIFEGIVKDGTVMCPLHGWAYSISTGQNVNLRQGIKSLKSYVVIEKDSFVYLKKPEFQIPKWRR